MHIYNVIHLCNQCNLTFILDNSTHIYQNYNSEVCVCVCVCLFVQVLFENG